MPELCKAAEAALQQLQAAESLAALPELGAFVTAGYGAEAAAMLAAACAQPPLS